MCIKVSDHKSSQDAGWIQILSGNEYHFPNWHLHDISHHELQNAGWIQILGGMLWHWAPYYHIFVYEELRDLAYYLIPNFQDISPVRKSWEEWMANYTTYQTINSDI